MRIASPKLSCTRVLGLALVLHTLACSGAHTSPLPDLPAGSLQVSCLPARDPETQAAGKKVYLRVCASCHQMDGRGLAGIFPPLAGHAPKLAQTTAGKSYLMRLVLWGLSGPMTIDKIIYNNVMPPQAGMLSDAEVAAVLSYVMQAFDNCRAFAQAPHFEASEVKVLRQRTDTGLGTFELRKTTAFAPRPPAS